MIQIGYSELEKKFDREHRKAASKLAERQTLNAKAIWRREFSPFRQFFW